MINSVTNIHILRKNPTSRWVDFKNNPSIEWVYPNLRMRIHQPAAIKKKTDQRAGLRPRSNQTAGVGCEPYHCFRCKKPTASLFQGLELFRGLEFVHAVCFPLCVGAPVCMFEQGSAGLVGDLR